MHLTICYSILIILCSSLVKSQKRCETPEKKLGTCISINQCKPIVDLIEEADKPLSPFIISFLQARFCELRGYDHYICCANEHTTTTPSTRLTDIEIPKIEDVLNHRNINLLPINCGQLPEDKVSNGQNTSVNEFPFMTLLRYKTPNGLEFQCGGTIINQKYILTAAHCITGSRYSLVSVRVGEHVISTERDCSIIYGNMEYCAPPFEDIEVEEVKIYPEYNKPYYAHDIAVVRLRKNINLDNKNMKAICLPINNENQSSTLDYVLTAGWGTTEFKTRSDILLKARLPVVDRDNCQKQNKLVQIVESQLCAGGVNQTDTCRGDSGGPVFFSGRYRASIRFVQYGIVAAGHSVCGGDSNYPGIYTTTQYYMKWILDQLRP